MASANILAFAVVIAWTSTIVTGQMMASIHVAYDKSSIDYFVYFQFNLSMLQKFFSCLCTGRAAKCVAHYELARYTVTDVTDEGLVTSGQISRTYKCTHGASQSNVICEQQRPQDLPDFSSGNVLSQSFLITQSPCGSTCIVFIWQLHGEGMSYDDSVGAVNCGTNCACTRSTLAAVTPPTATSQISPIPIESKTTETASKTTITISSTSSTTVKTFVSTSSLSPSPSTITRTTTTNKAIMIPTARRTTTSISNVISSHDSFPTTAANLGTITSDENTPIGEIVGVVIGVIIVTAAIVIGIIVWKRRSAASEMSDKMHHQMDTPKARTLGPKSRNNLDGTSNTQLSPTGNSDLEGETFPVPHKTKHQHDAIPDDIAKNRTSFTSLTYSQQHYNERNAPDHEYANDNLASVHKSNRKVENNRMAKENASGHKGKQPKRSTAEDDFGYAFAEDPPDQEKSQQLKSSTASSPQRTSFSNRGCSGEDYSYASVDDVDVFGGGNGGTGPDYENWIENTLQSRNNNCDNETKRKNIPSTVLVGNVRNIDRISESRNYGYSYTDQEFSKGSKATSAFGLVNACGSGNSDYEYPVTASDYDSVSVNGNTQINNKPNTWTQNIDDDNSTAGSESLSSKPSSVACSNSKNVDAKYHDELREMDNPYNNLLSLKEDPTADPSQNNLLDNQSARYSNIQSIRKAFSSCESAETMPVTDVASTKL